MKRKSLLFNDLNNLIAFYSARGCIVPLYIFIIYPRNTKSYMALKHNLYLTISLTD